MTDKRTQLIAVNSCWVCLAFFGLGWVVLAGFLPPPSPHDTALQIADRFRGNTTGIRVGMVISIMASAFLLPWGGAVCAQMKRIEGRHAVLTWTWIAAQGCIVIEFIYPCAFWAVAAFRTGDPTRVQNFDDLAWLPFFGIVSTAIIQMIALGWLTLRDKREDPIYPRWFAYLQFWCAIGVIPAALVLAFHSGPFAWNGILAYWLGLTIAFVWLAATTVMTARAIKRMPDDDPAALDDDDLQARFTALEAEVASLRAERSEVLQ
jgi:hypothetical protein